MLLDKKKIGNVTKLVISWKPWKSLMSAPKVRPRLMKVAAMSSMNTNAMMVDAEMWIWNPISKATRTTSR